MQVSVYDFKMFYNSKIGRVVRRILRNRLLSIWPDVHDFCVMGYGYSTPFLRDYLDLSERCFSVMPAAQGVHAWPAQQGEKNLVCLAEEAELPIETESVDRILVVHGLEHAEVPTAQLQEIWRVLKSNGRALFIVPNRNGLWARAEWCPFGRGTPYSVSQLCGFLQENKFVHERTEEALFMPPVKSAFLMKSAAAFEYMGMTFLPFAAGVHMVEVSKQIYARVDGGGGTRIRARARSLLGARPGRSRAALETPSRSSKKL